MIVGPPWGGWFFVLTRFLRAPPLVFFSLGPATHKAAAKLLSTVLLDTDPSGILLGNTMLARLWRREGQGFIEMATVEPHESIGAFEGTPLEELTDEQLVTAHLQGRPGAFQRLYDRYRDRLIHFITRKTGDPDRAQDLVQEAFIRVTRHLHRFDTSKKFSTWVYTIASNLSKNELRNRSRSPLVLFQKLTGSWEDDHRPIQFEDYSMRPDDLYRKRFLRRLVEDTVEELPEHHRLVFRLRELEGKSYEEISEITGVNLGTVKSRLHRARNSFAQRIEPFLN